ncbi:hypothetical protein PNOK_0558300 [Pyrrhoderma noxium]|uniref:Uncharacterized protein n=1 Tax=Pyrrhoderma noxium TaxID=2282107 RepID=A0A286UGK4_9AGAM|nr:hypothetical protein PNOK_0558300 [Pyrrhoderma noxium]
MKMLRRVRDLVSVRRTQLNLIHWLAFQIIFPIIAEFKLVVHPPVLIDKLSSRLQLLLICSIFASSDPSPTPRTRLTGWFHETPLFVLT